MGQQFQEPGRSRGRFTVTIHAVAEALGLPIRVELSEAQVHDSTSIVKLISACLPEYWLADKAYDTNDFPDSVSKNDSEAVPP
ncbi:transposase [Desulfobotulus pelophilus]|uniref:transposase n=1 Tax=Desulfobotulus pelophilus TaxID=2823377 RepID=UPI0034A55B62